ncbi:DUF1850 domain-containing protein [Halobacillus litoralis]|uniref:DUF1850 domain-containing protein n=1 Tax=Halobacillus litoralis TaxID=45668 RepID=UPI001CD2D7DE|nr:DUF1850 domain-containing protein [Halobacillus litoralis]MCA0972211.1 DUF1850 domain-containing protein [Halobacillus litoralis]
MRTKWILSGVTLLGVVVFLTVFWLFFVERSVLAFQMMPEKEKNAYLTVSDEDHFQLKFTHSVHLSDVFEEYVVRQDKLEPVQLVYEDTAIGMPSNAEEGETFELHDGKYYIKNIKGDYDSLDIMIGQVRADHTILYQGEAYPLKDYLEAGSWIRIEPLHISNWQWLKGVKLK